LYVVSAFGVFRSRLDGVACAAALATYAACVSPATPAVRPQSESTAADSASTPSANHLAGDVRTAIERLILGARDASFELRAGERGQLETLYLTRGYQPLWMDSQGRATDLAHEALALIRDAADHGLDPDDYEAASLGQSARNMSAAAPADDAARFDVHLSAAFMRYLRHLHAGRIDPREIGFRVESATDEHDYAALIAAAVAADAIGHTVAVLTPKFGGYDALRAWLKRYRELADAAAVAALPAIATAVHPGDPYRGVAALNQLLLALGDLPADAGAPVAAGHYQGPLVDAVRRFQARHGLAADGVLGARTLEAMNTPLGWRVRQIELGLERLRWLPHAGDQRLVLVNVPMFRLWAWDATAPGGAPAVSSDVIVGRAFRTRTPLFVEQLEEVIFRPDWTVPVSILRSEILPQVRRDPGYLEQNDMEIVPAGGGRAVPPTPENIARLARGLVVRQRPGPRNSLGLLKFVFPNQESIYMHDTPAQALFSRSRRDFSHGCVRVRDPVALAEWALAGTSQWTRDRIGATMLGDKTVRAAVVRPTRVVLFYTTALISPEDGTLRFADDIYDHDVELDRALEASKGRSSCASAARRRASASRATSASFRFSPTMPSAASGAIAATTLVDGPSS
jgi:murein L,D-transpeptidase YcbB/YkuD